MTDLQQDVRGALVPHRARWGRVTRVSDRDVALSVAVAGATVLASALLAARWSPGPGHGRIRRDYQRLEKARFNPPDWAFAIWGPLYLGLAVSGARIWNAPRSPARTRALGHWFGIQGLNAFWMWLGFNKRLRGAASIEAAATFANAALYVDAARKVDQPAAWLAAPYVPWVGFAALLSEELWRRNRD
jgi:tryptophan-rich sensory protein